LHQPSVIGKMLLLGLRNGKLRRSVLLPLPSTRLAGPRAHDLWGLKIYSKYPQNNSNMYLLGYLKPPHPLQLFQPLLGLHAILLNIVAHAMSILARGYSPEVITFLESGTVVMKGHKPNSNVRLGVQFVQSRHDGPTPA